MKRFSALLPRGRFWFGVLLFGALTRSFAFMDTVPTTPSGAGSGGLPGYSATPGVIGDPINAAYGNKYVEVTDYSSRVSPLRIVRYYDSMFPVDGSMGAHWRQEYDRHIEVISATVVKARRADGKAFEFTNDNGQWTSDADVNLRLQTLEKGGWKLTTARDDVELYDAQGHLMQITTGGMTQTLSYDRAGLLHTVADTYGHTLSFAYDAHIRVIRITDPAGRIYRYSYDAVGNLRSCVDPEGHSLTYTYEDAHLPHALTNVIVDGELFDSNRYDSQGRAVSDTWRSSDPAHPINHITVSYHDNGDATVSDNDGNTTTYHFTLILGVMKATSEISSCATCNNKTQLYTYDSNGNMTSYTDYNGVKTTYVYDLARNLEISRTEAVGTSQERTMTTEWHPTLNRPMRITEPDRVTTCTYDNKGNLLSRTVTDSATHESHIWTYSYSSFGQLTSRTLPNGESEHYDYDNRGNLTRATTSAGLVTKYDADGRVGTIIKPSGDTITYTYDGNGHVQAHVQIEHWWMKLWEWLIGHEHATPPEEKAVAQPL